MAGAAVAWAGRARLTRVALLHGCFIALVVAAGAAGGSGPVAAAGGAVEWMVPVVVLLLSLALLFVAARRLSRSPARVEAANLGWLADEERVTPPPTPVAIHLRRPLLSWVWRPFVSAACFWNFARGQDFPLPGFGPWVFLLLGIVMAVAAVAGYVRSREPLALLGPDGVHLTRSESSAPVPWAGIGRIRPLAEAVWNPPHTFKAAYRSYLAWELLSGGDLERRLGLVGDSEYPTLARQLPGFLFDIARIRPDALTIIRASRAFAAAAGEPQETEASGGDGTPSASATA
ncbi:hypothetical protein [Plantactinospora sp. B5E13]|uniref:hypothetical protein n=1 Tax=unclassified Plantactinospora TaxID=2631981 RepID=UPI00325F4176